MVADNLFLTVWSAWLEDLSRAGFAYADKGLITLRSRNWSLLILPCLGRGKLLCEISRACRIAPAHFSIAPQGQPASQPDHKPGLGVYGVLSGMGPKWIHGLPREECQ